MKESEKIEKKIIDLSDEKKNLNDKIKGVPRGYYEDKFLGYRTQLGSGSFLESVKDALNNRENSKFIQILKYEGHIITKEKLSELQSKVIKENEPHIKRIKEIDKIILVLEKNLIEAKEILEIPNNKTESEIDEGKLISSLLEVILGNDLKKYSLRKMERSLKKIGFTADHNSLHKKFTNQNFQLFLIAGIMRKKDQVKKEDEKDKLKSFEDWFNKSYLKVKGTNRKPKVNAFEGKEETNEFIDNIDLDE